MRVEHEPLDPSERRDLLTALDRLEERLETAPEGLHAFGGRADEGTLAGADLPPGAALLWARYDGVELMSGEARVFGLVELASATEAARADGLLIDGDVVIGERGRVLFALPPDPWAEGASVVSITEEVERAPEASSVIHLLLGLLGEIGVLYDDDGEFHDGLIDEWGELEPSAHRKLLRRRLDLDPIAPAPRLRLVQLLRAGEEYRAAAKEADRVLHYAPEYAAAHYEKARALLSMTQAEPARRSFVRASEHAADPINAAAYEAWAACAAHAAQNEDEARRHAAAVLKARPDFAQHQLAGAQGRWTRRDRTGAQELLTLGLAVAPRNLELLSLRTEIESTPVRDDD
ncbi:MAG: hypothetical protein AAGA54_35360 [Myxococcota bacterium]